MSAERMRVKGLKFQTEALLFFPVPYSGLPADTSPWFGPPPGLRLSDEPDWLARDLTPAFRAVSAGC